MSPSRGSHLLRSTRSSRNALGPRVADAAQNKALSEHDTTAQFAVYLHRAAPLAMRHQHQSCLCSMRSSPQSSISFLCVGNSFSFCCSECLRSRRRLVVDSGLDPADPVCAVFGTVPIKQHQGEWSLTLLYFLPLKVSRLLSFLFFRASVVLFAQLMVYDFAEFVLIRCDEAVP